jgi:methionyl-tRNA formyltransferase
MADKDIRIIFWGTPDFAVASLNALLVANYDVCAVVTAPDRQSGRGRKLGMSPVKAFALEHKLPVLQPENLKDPSFIGQLKQLNATLYIVVAFRMLPEIIWSIPVLGTFNLHASLLPQYRGAAPINRAIMNGEKTGGLTTFFLQERMDTGNIIFREETKISSYETAGEYHDRLKLMGASLLVKTVEAIKGEHVLTLKQDDLIDNGVVLRTAPKIFKKDCRIDWSKDCEVVYNLIRGLSPSPGAFTEIPLTGKGNIYIKIFRAEIKPCSCTNISGTVITDRKSYFNICCGDGCISVLELQQAGKRRMAIGDFLIGLSPSVLFKTS